MSASGFAAASFAGVEAEEVEILADRGHEAAVHALGLEPQHHHDVDAFEAGGHVVKHLDAQPVDRRREQGARRHHAHAGAHGVEEMDVGARDAAVQDVAADRDHQALEPALAPADGERVQQRLGRVLVAAVAGVDDGAVDLLGQEMHGAGLRVPHHQHVGVHGVEGHGGVDQGLALLDRARPPPTC